MTDEQRKIWGELKEKNPDKLLLFRCGDFYEVYGTDALECSKILGITATQHADRTVSAGFPHHALDTYLPKLMRAGKRVAICEFPIEPPKKCGIAETIEQTSETKNSEEKTMTNEIKAADLIGKTIIVGDNVATIEIKSASGDILQGEFRKGESTMPMPLNMAQVKKMLDDGIWHVGEGTKAEPKQEPKAEKKAAPKQEKPKAEKKAAEKKAEPKAEKKAAPKQEKPKAEPKQEKAGKYSFAEYTNKKGKTCGRLNGVAEQDEAYTNAAELHASASYEKTKNGKAFFLIFGPRYVAAGREVCEALNAGKPLAELKAIVDKATEERAARREEWKQKREEYKENKPSEPADATTYTAEDVARLLDDVLAGKPIPKEIQALMKAKAA